MSWAPVSSLRQLQANLAWNGPELYVGTDDRRLTWAGPSGYALADILVRRLNRCSPAGVPGASASEPAPSPASIPGRIEASRVSR
jgi:hypothetical protein